MNDDTLQSLHGQANDALVRFLFQRMCELRSGVSHISEAAIKPARDTPLPTNAPGLAGQGGDIASGESGGVKACAA